MKHLSSLPLLCFVVGLCLFASSSTRPKKMRALAECAQALGVIRTAIAAADIADSSVIILPADHGGHDHPATGTPTASNEACHPHPARTVLRTRMT